jgi:hypothetical protein
MEFLEYQRRQMVEGTRRKITAEASKAVDTLVGLGWSSDNFADIAAGLKRRELANANRPLRKLVTPKSNQGK